MKRSCCTELGDPGRERPFCHAIGIMLPGDDKSMALRFFIMRFLECEEYQLHREPADDALLQEFGLPVTT